ncbi:hypothetical protein Zmor_006897 [Zophobas morio]|uniref:RNA-directed DNA polymerase n=1 Tax=Zophobas morio TaxID=2755281 RepID=A0AA38IX58_9CUCU|nr:hypothetical protein Zmor_006897 [Zophobas morio]
MKTVLWAQEASVIPNNFLGHIMVRGDLTSAELCIESELKDLGGIIPRCVVKTDDNGEGVVPVLNISGKPVNIGKDRGIARGECCVEGNQRREVNQEPVVEAEVNIEVTSDEKDQLMSLLNEYKDLVARNMKQLGCTTLVEMDIQLEDDRPIYYRPYRMAYSERRKVQEIVEELKDAGIVEDSFSPFASPVLLVKKKSGDVRLCVDYRSLNKKTVKEHYPLPRIDDQLDRLKDQVFYTSLDLSGAYYQIPLSQESRDKSAFITPDGVYNFKRMSFGMANAPSQFQRLINIVLGNLRYDTAMAYLDDVIIASKTFEEGLVKIREVFERFRDANLTLNLKKCFFFMRKIDYLGFTISVHGIEPGEHKVKAVSDFPIPTDIHKVRSFMGLASYFRRFIKSFATIARPISDLLRKGESFVWGESQQRAFDKIRDTLVRKPVLCVYDPSARTELHTDACCIGLGAVLMQEQANGKLQPIAYYSRKTSREESRYSSFELEGLAVIAALDKFRVYLLGIPFVIRTDCNSLKLLAKKRDMNPRIGRWFVKLSEFNYTIEYHKSEFNKPADALSRNPVEKDDEVPLTGLPILGIRINTDWVAALQRTCDEIKAIVTKLEEGDQNIHQKFTLYKGRVYKVKGAIWRLYVPVDLRYDIVSEAHKELMHLGIDKTLARVKESYYFPKMREFVTSYVNRCINCLYYKTPRGRQPGFLHPLEKGRQPFEVVHIDHLGPFITSVNDNKYVVALIDGYSKYAVMKAVPNVGATETVKFVREFITNYGKPDRIITDRGTAFVSREFEVFCENYNIQHIRISTGVPRANGQVEKLNSMIISCTSTSTSDIEGNDWDVKLHEVQWAVNNSIHAVTKSSPFSLIYKYKRDGFSSNPLAREIKEVNDRVGNTLPEIPVDELLAQNREKMERQFNKKRKTPREYNPGDLVLIRAEVPATGQSRKLEPKYRGPYEVVKSIGNDRYLIQDVPGEQQSNRFYKGIISVDRLKLVREK